MNFISTFLITKVLAAPPAINPNPVNGTPAPISATSGDFATGAKAFIGDISGNIINLLTVIAGIAAVGFIIYYGILYITSAGNADKTKIARAGIINAVIGVIIITAAYAIIRIAAKVGGYADLAI